MLCVANNTVIWNFYVWLVIEILFTVSKTFLRQDLSRGDLNIQKVTLGYDKKKEHNSTIVQ